MPLGRYAVLRTQTREMVYNVYNFIKKESEEGLQFNLNCVQKRTAAATGVSVNTCRQIVNLVKTSNASLGLRTPGKKRLARKRVTEANCYDQLVIRRIVHTFHVVEGKLPTLIQLVKKLKTEINFSGSTTSLQTLLKNLGFKYKRTEDNKKILIENTNIRFERMVYLAKVSKYRADGRPIVYTTESFVDVSYRNSIEKPENRPKKTVTKNFRIVIANAKYETGLCLLVFKEGIKTGDYQGTMDSENYERWVQTQLIPGLPPNSVVVLSNAPYSKKIEDRPPTSNAKKSDMISWLIDKGVPCNENMLKPELFKLISLTKNKTNKYKIDKLFQEHNHTVLRLPPNHQDLNPLEMAWVDIKRFVMEENVQCDVNNAIRLIEEKVNSMAESEWTALYDEVKKVEEEYKRSEQIIDDLTDEFTFRASDNESEEEEEQDYSENDTDSSDEDLSSD